MFVGVCRLSFYLPDIGSLKSKRSVIKKITGRTRAKFAVSIAEVGDNDALRTAQVGFAVVSNQQAHASAMMHRIAGFIDALGVAKLVDIRTEVMAMGDLDTVSWDDDQWIADFRFED